MINIFLSIAAAMSVLLLAWIVRGLRSGRPDTNAQLRRDFNVTAFREELAELDRLHQAAPLAADEFARRKQELEARLLAEVGDGPDSGFPVSRFPLPAQLGLAALPLLIAAAIFISTDGNQHFGESATALEQDSIEDMVQQLADRLAEAPDDRSGWILLGRTYSVMQRHAQAAQAYQRANALSESPDPDLLVAEGESLALARDKDLLGRPQQLIAQALAIDPQHMRAQWYAGVAASQQGQDQVAESYFARLRARSDLPPELAEVLGVKTAPATDPGKLAATQDSVATPATRLEVAVSIAPELVGEMDPQAALFVYAKARSGPPMPLAIQRLSAQQLPIEVVLDSSMSMVAGMNLDRFDEWQIVARVSRSGSAQPSAGDLQGLILADRRSPQPIQVQISTILP